MSYKHTLKPPPKPTKGKFIMIISFEQAKKVQARREELNKRGYAKAVRRYLDNRRNVDIMKHIKLK